MTEGQRKPWCNHPENKNFYNEDYLVKIFEDENEEEIKKAAEIHRWSEDQIDSRRYYFPLRRKTIDLARQNLVQRIASHSKPSVAEINMGCYTEQIEPQVRRAVVDLRNKGYSTFSSGFDGDGQSITFELEDLTDFQLPQSLKQEFLEKGVDLTLIGNKIRMTFYNFFTLNQIEQFWHEISLALPDLNKQAPPCFTNSAQEFRRVHA